jgi:hypothetical protein
MYCIDTSALIAAWYERYPPEVFPPLWLRIDQLIAAGKLFAPEEVRTECEKRGDPAIGLWLKERKQMFLTLDQPVMTRVSSILAAHPRLVAVKKTRFAADPFVIGTALERRFVIITEENATRNLNRPNIPDVCNDPAYKADCINLLDWIKREKWVIG